ncbi:MAG: DNA polymerase III subunit delta [Candidatus Uhrbacteria bacterium]|nr:DNA polymerase III subunit delta [Candidatus Uhrbacteria bacterium]
MLIVVHGADAYRVKERVAEMRQKFLEKFDPSGMNLAELVIRLASDVKLGEIAQHMQASPFLSPKRMVILTGLMSSLKKPDVAPWQELLQRTPDSSIVILVETTSSEKTQKFPLFIALQGHADLHVYAIDQLQGSALRLWILDRAAARCASLSPQMADTLIARVGSETWLLQAELEKLVAFANGEPITAAMVDLLCGTTFNEDVFGLLDAFTGDPGRALERLAKERRAGAEDFPLFGMVTRQIRLLLAYRLFVDRTGSSQGIASALGIHPFVAQKLGKEAGRHSLLHLRAWHRRARELDRAMKRGLSPRLAVDRLVTEAVSGLKLDES